MHRSSQSSLALAPVTALVCALALGAPAPDAFAAWTPGGVALETATANQTDPIAVPDGTGGSYVVWMDNRNGNADIFAQHVLGDGTKAPGWPADGVTVCDLTVAQTTVVACSDGLGGAYVVWGDSHNGNPDVFAMRLVTAGTAPGFPDDGLLVAGGLGSQLTPVVAPDGSGGAIVAWSDTRGATADIYAMRVLGTGTVDPSWTVNGNVLCNAAKSQQAPTMCADGTGGAIVAWVDGRNGTTLAPDQDLYAVRVTQAGVPAAGWTANGDPVCMLGTSDSYTPVATSDGASGIFVVWTDGRNGLRADGLQDLFAMRLDSAGDPAAGWTLNGVPVTQAAGIQTLPQLASDGSGGLFVAWQDGRDTSVFPANADIYGLRLTSAGQIAAGWSTNGTDLTAISPTREEDPTICAGAAHDFYVAWEDGRNSGRVYLLRIAGDASRPAGWPAGGIEIAPATAAPQLNPALCADGSGGAIVSWDDPRVSVQDRNVFALRYSSNGQLGPVVGVADGFAAGAGIRLALRGAHPAVGRAQFSLEVDGGMPYTASVYGPAGRRVWNAETVSSGDDGAGAGTSASVSLTWDGRDDAGRRVPPGVYWLRVVGASHSAALRFVFLP
jgi:hypothetical protein